MGASGVCTSTPETLVALAPHDDPTPIEQAAVGGIAAGFPSETFLWSSSTDPTAEPASGTPGPPAEHRSATPSTAMP